jgi:hypothetical protein
VHAVSPTTTQIAMSAAVVAVARFRAACNCSNVDSDRAGLDVMVEIASLSVDGNTEACRLAVGLYGGRRFSNLDTVMVGVELSRYGRWRKRRLWARDI